MKRVKFLVLPLAVLAVFLLIGAIIFYFVEKRVHDNFFNEIVFTSDTAIAAVNADRVKRMADLIPGDIPNNDDLIRLKEQILSLGNSFKSRGIDAIYLLSQKENKIYFIVESTPFGDPLYVAPGRFYEQAPVEAVDSFSKHLPILTSKYTDEYGTYLSRFTPVIDKNGQQVGVLGVDIDYNYYQSNLIRTGIIFEAAWLLLYSLIILFFFYFKNINGLKNSSEINEQKIRAISDSISDGIIVVNSDKEVTYWNKTSELIFGFSARQASEFKFEDVVKIKEAINIKTNQVVADFDFTSQGYFTDSAFEIKLDNYDKTKKLFELLITAVEIHHSKYLVGIFHDISLRKEREDVLERQKGELETLNNLMVGRELKMTELKKEVMELKEKLKK
jgi:PAS domain S-box-containing protein